MEKLVLKANERDVNTKTSDIRKGVTNDGKRAVPAVVYGHGAENIHITLDNSDFLRTFRKAGHSTIVTLEIGKKKVDVLTHEVQKEPVSGDFLHVDFQIIKAGEKVQTEIALSFVGQSPATTLGANIEKTLHEVVVKCLPKDLVPSFEVDLGRLTEDGSILHVKDLGIDTEKYEIITDENATVVASNIPRRAKAEAETTEEATAEGGEAEGGEETTEV